MHLIFYAFPGELIFQLNEAVGLSSFLKKSRRSSGKRPTLGGVLDRMVKDFVLGTSFNAIFLYLASIWSVTWVRRDLTLGFDAACLLVTLLLARKKSSPTIFHLIAGAFGRTTERLTGERHERERAIFRILHATFLLVVFYYVVEAFFIIFYRFNDHALFTDSYAYLETLRGFMELNSEHVRFFSLTDQYFQGFDLYLVQYFWIAPDQWEWFARYFLPFVHLSVGFFLVSSFLARRFSKYFYVLSVPFFIWGYYLPTWVQFVLPNTWCLWLFFVLIEDLCYEREGPVVLLVVVSSMILFSLPTLVALAIPLAVAYGVPFMEEHGARLKDKKVLLGVVVACALVAGALAGIAVAFDGYLSSWEKYIMDNPDLFQPASGDDFAYRSYSHPYRWFAALAVVPFVACKLLSRLCEKLRGALTTSSVKLGEDKRDSTVNDGLEEGNSPSIGVPREENGLDRKKKRLLGDGAFFGTLYFFHAFFFEVATHVYDWALFSSLPYRAYRYLIFFEFSTWVLSCIFVAGLITAGFYGVKLAALALARVYSTVKFIRKSYPLTPRGVVRFSYVGKTVVVFGLLVGVYLGAPIREAYFTDADLYTVRKNWHVAKFTYFIPSNISDICSEVGNITGEGALLFLNPDVFEPRVVGTYLVKVGIIDTKTAYQHLSSPFSSIVDFLTGTDPKKLSATHPYNFELSEELTVTRPVDYVMLDSNTSDLVQYLQSQPGFELVARFYVPANSYQGERHVYLFRVWA